MKEYFGAIDLSGQSAALAVADGAGRVLWDKTQPMRGRESAKLAAFVVESLRAAGLELTDVTSWTVGSGPGSFTGMRLAAALVEGWSFDRPEVRTRCVPGALALAEQARCGTGRAAVLFDGRNSEFLLYEVVCADGKFTPGARQCVLNKTQLEQTINGEDFTTCVMLGADVPAMTKLIGGVPERVRTVPELSAAPLLGMAHFPYDNKLTDLVYIRPAVFTNPV